MGSYGLPEWKYGVIQMSSMNADNRKEVVIY